MIVMKFGGTSVQDAQAIDRVAAIVRDRLPEKPVVVVSALAKITDLLLAMARRRPRASAKGPWNLPALRGAPLQHRRQTCWARMLLSRLRPNWKPTSTGWTIFARDGCRGRVDAADHGQHCRFWRRLSSKMAAAAFSQRNIQAPQWIRASALSPTQTGKAVPQFEETDAG